MNRKSSPQAARTRFSISASDAMSATVTKSEAWALVLMSAAVRLAKCGMISISDAAFAVATRKSMS